MKQKVLKLTLNNSSLIELSGHSGDGMPFRIIRDAEYKKELKKIVRICLTYLTGLCYSKKCAIVDSYAMIS